MADVTYTGVRSLGGVPTRTYHLVRKSNGAVDDLWIGMNDLPLQAIARTSHGPVTIRYSRFNQPMAIAAP